MKRYAVRRMIRGASLVEMVMFIVIMGVVVGGLVIGYVESLRSAPQSKNMTEALQLAKERMELIRGQRIRLGFSAFSILTYDPCLTGSTHPSCTSGSAYTVERCFYSGTGANSTCTFGDTISQCFSGNTDYKCVRVRVLDVNNNNKQIAQLDEAFGNY